MEKRNELVQELKDQHGKIASIIKEIDEIGVDTREGQNKLLEMRQAFLDHLRKEDEEFYPFLEKKAESDEDLQLTVRTFADDMRIITAFATEFFDKYSEGYQGKRDSESFKGFMDIIKNRIEREERILFPEYDKI